VLTGTPLAAARRRRFTYMSEGPIMSTFGIVLMLLGAALAAAEAHVPSHGALGSAAAVAVAAGIALVVAGAGSERPSR
jgi:membrane-bound ClpP family serine protease